MELKYLLLTNDHDLKELTFRMVDKIKLRNAIDLYRKVCVPIFVWLISVTCIFLFVPRYVVFLSGLSFIMEITQNILRGYCTPYYKQLFLYNKLLKSRKKSAVSYISLSGNNFFVYKSCFFMAISKLVPKKKLFIIRSS